MMETSVPNKPKDSTKRLLLLVGIGVLLLVSAYAGFNHLQAQKEARIQAERDAVEARLRAEKQKQLETYRTSGKQALDALAALHSVVKVGVSYRDYPTRLQDCKIQVDKFLSDNPEELVPGFNSSVSKAMAAYEDAFTWWSIEFEGDGVQKFAPETNSTVQEICRKYPDFPSKMTEFNTEYGYYISAGTSVLWAQASNSTTEAESLLGSSH